MGKEVDRTQYVNPLVDRYCSEEMSYNFSDVRKFRTWRRLWIALAESEQQLGIEITDEQVEELKANEDNIDFEFARQKEKELRHDVMAHIHTFGEVCPKARGIIHLGATSAFVGDNTDLIQIRDALDMVIRKLAAIIDALATFAAEWKDLPCLAFTHIQPAQLTTLGKRATLWLQDFVLDMEELEFRKKTLRFRGVKGTTGTQASFLQLFKGEGDKVDELDELVTEKLGFTQRYGVTGQTYPRKVDYSVLSALAGVAITTHKMANDIRLMQTRGELEEPFETKQIGSSAMAYKRNPMRCERACGMARFVMTLAASPLQTASVQWLERTLDDSSNRRLVLPEAFLALDGVLDVMRNVADGLIVRPAIVQARLQAELPFMATEDIMMAAVKEGADRQEAHEAVRQHALAAADRVKSGQENDLLARLRTDPLFASVDLSDVLDPMRYVGTCPEQVARFTKDVAEPVRNRWHNRLSESVDLEI